MTELPPFQTLLGEQTQCTALPLAPVLAAIYGRLAFPAHSGRPYVLGNFVSTLDGVVTLDSGKSAGGEISGSNNHDRLLMGLLRAIADVIIIGAGTLRAEPDHLWTAEHIAPDFAAPFRATRQLLGKTAQPLTILVTASAELDLSLPVFQSGATAVRIVTTDAAAGRLRRQTLPPSVEVAVAGTGGKVTAAAILAVAQRDQPRDIIVTEGGPQLLGDFLAEGVLDELFLTLAPQVAGRDDAARRPGFVAGREFAPAQPLWAGLSDVKRAGDHLFLRYTFEPAHSPIGALTGIGKGQQ